MSESMLHGRGVLITGGGTGVGADLARGFAGAGARVVIAGRRRDVLETVVGDGITAVVADVTNEASVAIIPSPPSPRAGP